MDSSTFEYALRLPNSLFKTNREKFFAAFKQKVTEHEKALIVFKGKDDLPVDDTDIDYVVRQESFFYYLFGVQETGCSAAIDITEEKVILFYPRFDEIYKLWMKVLSLEDVQELYPDFEVRFVDEMEDYVKDFSPSQIFINKGINSDSGAETIVPKFKWLEEHKVETELLHPILSECRVTKNPEEITILEVANKISSEAHCWTMKHCKPGVRESYLESKFKAYCMENYNCKIVPYVSI